MKDKTELRIFALFFVMLGVFAWVTNSAVQTIHRAIRSNDWVNHTHDVILHSSDILTYLHAGDTALRDFLITGEHRDQQAYREDYQTMIDRLDEGLALTRLDPEEATAHAQFLALQNLISNRIDIARSMIKARAQGGLNAVQNVFASHADVESIAQINRAAQQLISREQDLLRQRDQAEVLRAQATNTVLYVGMGLNFVLLALVLWLIRNDIAARRRSAKALETANATLEERVNERTSELVRSNLTLKQENLERRWSAQALDHQLRYNQLIINSINELVFVVSRALNISRINPAVVQQTHWEPQDLIAQSIDRVLQIGPDGAPPGQSPISIALRDGREIQDRIASLLTRTGRTLPVRFNLVPLHDQDKVVGGVITVRISENPRQTS